jgi:trimeric autotransporter adhesin
MTFGLANLARAARHAVALGLLMVQSLPAQVSDSADCQPSWQPTFGQPHFGVAGPHIYTGVYALAEFDDGGGPALFVGGDFTSAGGTPAMNIARWDGTSWSALGSGMDGTVHSLAVFDDGTGPALYAGGQFTVAGGQAANHIAKWDGSIWSSLGTGMSGGVVIETTVHALVGFDDGSGPALFAGGNFTVADGLPASRIAKWDGSVWSALDAGVDDEVLALAVVDAAGVPTLHVGGRFDTAGGAPANAIATWDGAVWSPLGGGLTGAFVRAAAFAVFDDGSGPALHVGGFFAAAGGLAAESVAKWDGATWSALGAGVSGGILPDVWALAVFDDGGGPALYAGGGFTTAGRTPVDGIARWNGSEWSALDNEPGLDLLALTVFDDGDGPALFAGGFFGHHVASWDGSSWSALGSGMNGAVLALAEFDDGGGPALHAGGAFTTAGDVEAQRIAKWSGSTWSELDGGLDAEVRALAVFDDGSGTALYAGGDFTSADGASANHVARWSGSGWSALGSGLDGDVLALCVFDDGSGPALYAGGSFIIAGGLGASRIARWDGSSWSPLGTGVNGSVTAMAVFDDGSGPAPHAAGGFTLAGGVAADHIAKWNGSNWSKLGGGTSGDVFALAVFDDGDGPALFVGGTFTNAGGFALPQELRIAKWDGASWSALGSGMNNQVTALAVFDDGTGEALHAGGLFTTAGGIPAQHVARWDGSSWSSLGSGATSGVKALSVVDDGSGPALLACSSGFFVDSGDKYLAKWIGCPAASPWTDLGFALSGVSGAPALAGSGDLTTGSAGMVALSSAAPLAPSLLVISTIGAPAPFQCGTLVPVPVQAIVAQLTSPTGEASASWSAWPAGLSGTSFHVQWVIDDAGATCGVALSNALRADVP